MGAKQLGGPRVDLPGEQSWAKLEHGRGQQQLVQRGAAYSLSRPPPDTVALAVPVSCT